MAEALAADLRGYATGKWHDETGWPDVALHACKILNAAEKVVFLTASEIAEAPAYVKRAKDDGYRIVTVPDELRRKLGGATDIVGNPIVDLGMFNQRWLDVQRVAVSRKPSFAWLETTAARVYRLPDTLFAWAFDVVASTLAGGGNESVGMFPTPIEFEVLKGRTYADFVQVSDLPGSDVPT